MNLAWKPGCAFLPTFYDYLFTTLPLPHFRILAAVCLTVSRPSPRGLRISDARLTIRLVTSRVSSGLPATSRLKRRALIKKDTNVCMCLSLVFENQEKGIEKGINKRIEGISRKRFSVVKRREEKGKERKKWSNDPLSVNRFQEDPTNLFASRTSNRISVSPPPTINRRVPRRRFVGACDNVRISLSLFLSLPFFLFHLRSFVNQIVFSLDLHRRSSPVVIAALSS